MFLAGMACGVMASALVALCLRAMQRTRTPVVQPPPAPIETYGHAFDPVGELQANLPPAPDGMYWESGVRYTDHEPELWLGLLDANLNAIVAETNISLVKRGPGELFTWASDYQHYGPAYTANKARIEIVLPLLNWAKAELNKRKDNGIERYGISG
jgi:hypothetical protein